jgi:hypothetical protein
LTTKQDKWMRAINMGAEAMTLAVQLVDSARQRAKSAGKEAERIVHDFRNDAAYRAEALGKNAGDRLRPKPSTGTRVLQFFAGVGVGVAAGVLFSPPAGKETRERLFAKAEHLKNRA